MIKFPFDVLFPKKPFSTKAHKSNNMNYAVPLRNFDIFPHTHCMFPCIRLMPIVETTHASIDDE